MILVLLDKKISAKILLKLGEEVCWYCTLKRWGVALFKKKKNVYLNDEADRPFQN